MVYRVSDGLNGLNGLNCLNKQRLIAERFGGLYEGLVSRDRRAIRERIETQPKFGKWFQDLTRLSIKSRFDPWPGFRVEDGPGMIDAGSGRSSSVVAGY